MSTIASAKTIRRAADAAGDPSAVRTSAVTEGNNGLTQVRSAKAPHPVHNSTAATQNAGSPISARTPHAVDGEAQLSPCGLPALPISCGVTTRQLMGPEGSDEICQLHSWNGFLSKARADSSMVRLPATPLTVLAQLITKTSRVSKNSRTTCIPTSDSVLPARKHSPP